jgi:choline dehydrogenase-like flavoprotein
MAEPRAPEPGNDQRARAWLSKSLAALFADDRPPCFNVLIIGSGYGGAVAAAALAGARLRLPDGVEREVRIGVLERGREYLPGAFPSRLSELPGHVRFSVPGEAQPKGVRTGLFDVRVSGDMVSVVANGVGGGSLINAGVMLRARREVLAEAQWPFDIRSNPDILNPFYERAEQWLGVRSAKGLNTVARARNGAPDKHAVMQAAGRAGAGRVPDQVVTVDAVPLTVAFEPGPSTTGVPLAGCIACGDCATGCNHGAKQSLDVNLLALAWRRGAEIYTGATVLRVERLGAYRWSVVVNHTDAALRARQAEPLRIEAEHVILAAGTFGSTEILLRSRPGLPLSSRLGDRFSGNGDLFAAAYDMADVNAVADESVAPPERNVGPTITAAITAEDRQDRELAVSIQELAVPGPLRRLFEEIFATGRTLYALDERDGTTHREGDADRNAVDARAFRRRTLPIALIGRDTAGGKLVLEPGDPAAPDSDGDGAVRVCWDDAVHDPRFDRHLEMAERLLASGRPGFRLLPNPVWKLQPDEAAQRLGLNRGPLLTVHPLGGCPMGDNVHSGVVDQYGRVFDPEADVHPGLFVLDGSIVPTSLGINPALTIAALSLRAVEALRRNWPLLPGSGLEDIESARRAVEEERPRFRAPHPPIAPIATRVQIIERLRGNAVLADGRQHHIELTLHSQPVRLTALASPIAAEREITYDGAASRLRVFDKEPSPISEDRSELPPPIAGDPRSQPAVLEATADVVRGSLMVLQPERSRSWVRGVRGLIAWVRHRALRDIVQRVAGRIAGLTPPPDPRQPPRPPLLKRLWKEINNAWALATRAGAVRTLEYRLVLTGFTRVDGRPATTLFGGAAVDGAELEVRGRKRLTYDGKSSPWTQLMELPVSKFPGLSGPTPVLSLDLPYLARQGVPLLRVVGQQDHVQALVDLASLNLYVLRTLIDGHTWSFRRPDRVPERQITRLPGAGRPPMDSPEITELWVRDLVSPGRPPKPMHLRLTRYRPIPSRRGARPPVLLIHGYSASGTTFVHPTLRPGLAEYLVDSGRDVWVLDLRSSCGMPGSREPWTFEEIGFEDIPLAVAYVAEVCRARVDVVAHCMGSAMLWMGLLGDVPSLSYPDERYPKLRQAMRGHLRRIVLSQVGPVVMMSPANQARAFVMRYVRQLLPMGEYVFRPDGDGTMADMLLDRLLATLPYPRAEFRLENPRLPWKTSPWVRSRRRMDVLYGQVFELGKMSSETLDYLDDFFGPMNVETVSQVIHFAGVRAITDAQGRHVFATRDHLRDLGDLRILAIHGDQNGLADGSTLDLLRLAFGNERLEVQRFDGFGHQDGLIGNDTRAVFERIERFLR